MIGRRISTAGLSLLSVIALCAVGAQSASAAGEPATNTTGFTCLKGEGELDFADPHCDEKVLAGTGDYGHVAISVGEVTEVETTNKGTSNETTESTPAVLSTSIFGIEPRITCNSAQGTGTFKNEEPEPGVHTGSGEGKSWGRR